MVTNQQQTVSNTLDEELLRLLARQGRRMPYPVFLAAVMLTWLANDPPRLPDRAAGLWLCAVALVLGARTLVLARLPRQAGVSPKRRLRIAIWLSALNGVSHASGLLLFPAPNGFQLAIQSILLVGLCAGSVATTAGYRPVFLAYLLPVMGTLVARWSVDSAHPGGGAIAAISAIFGAVLVSLAGDAFRLFRESFDIRLQHVKLNEQLRLALAQAETANRAKTRFLASASHDLRQPIHTLSLFAAALAMRPLDAVSRDISGHIDTALANLTGQLDALLDISKLDAGVVASQPGPVALAPFIERLRADFAPIAAAKGLALTVSPASAALYTDALLLRRIVANLLDNAIKYTDQGTVDLAVVARADQVALLIEDSGRGIAPQEQDRVFEEFYQLDNAERDRTKGLGLGLSIVTRLVDLLGARMEMISAPGRGTSYYLIFPAYHGGAAAGAPAPAPAVNALAGRRVLVVDDEHAIRLGMRALLQGLGAAVILADGLAQAMTAVRGHPPDLMLVDFRLRAGEDGIALVRAVRAACPGLPAILISGDTSPARLREARQAGIPLLHKPVPLALLAQAVADLLPATKESS